MKSWHEDLITIVIDEDNKLYWHKNSANDEGLNGPFDTDIDIRKYTDKHINFRYILLEKLQQKFITKNTYIAKSNEKDLEEDVRYRYRRNIFGIIEFIGKLYKKNMISEIIIHLCLIDLIKYYQPNDEIYQEYIECFHILWKIIDEKIISPMKPNLAYQYNTYIKNNILCKKWSLRIEFMLEDIIDKYNKKYKNFKKKSPRATKFNIKSNKNNLPTFNRPTSNLITSNPTTSSPNSSPNSSPTSSPNSSPKIQDNIVSDENIYEKLETILYQYKVDQNYVSHHIAKELHKYGKNVNDILDVMIYIVAEESKVHKKYSELLEKCNFIKKQDIIKALDRAIENIDEILLDVPNAKKNILDFITTISIEFDRNDIIIRNIFFSLTTD